MRLKFTATNIGLKIGSVLLTIMALVCAGRTTYEDDSALNKELEIKPPSTETKKSPNGCGHNLSANHVTGDGEDNHGYVNVSLDQANMGEKKPMPLPPTPDKPPKPSPRQSIDPVLET